MLQTVRWQKNTNKTSLKLAQEGGRLRAWVSFCFRGSSFGKARSDHY